MQDAAYTIGLPFLVWFSAMSLLAACWFVSERTRRVMSISYSKEQREIAKRDKLALFAVDIDGRPSDNGTGRYTSDGPLNCRLARALWLFCLKVSEGQKPAAAFKECFPGGQPLPIKRKRESQ